MHGWPCSCALASLRCASGRLDAPPGTCAAAAYSASTAKTSRTSTGQAHWRLLLPAEGHSGCADTHLWYFLRFLGHASGVRPVSQPQSCVGGFWQRKAAGCGLPSCRPAACTGASCCAAAPKQARLALAWPRMPIADRTWRAPLSLRAGLKPRCQCLLGAVCQRGDQVPASPFLRDPKLSTVASSIYHAGLHRPAKAILGADDAVPSPWELAAMTKSARTGSLACLRAHSRVAGALLAGANSALSS